MPSEVSHICEAARDSDAPLCASRLGQLRAGEDVTRKTMRDDRQRQADGAARGFEQASTPITDDHDVLRRRQAGAHAPVRA